jgi:hypothetical protein
MSEYAIHLCEKPQGSEVTVLGRRRVEHHFGRVMRGDRAVDGRGRDKRSAHVGRTYLT